MAEFLSVNLMLYACPATSVRLGRRLRTSVPEVWCHTAEVEKIPVDLESVSMKRAKVLKV